MSKGTNNTSNGVTPLPPSTGSEVFVGYNEPNTRGLLQDMEQAMMKLQSYTLTPDEVEIVYLAIARLHDLEDFGYRRDWDGIATYCPRTDEDEDDPQNAELTHPETKK